MIRSIFVSIAAVAITATAIAADSTPSPKTVEFRNVATALRTLKAKEGTKTSTQDGWTVIEDTVGTDHVTWNFTPDDHPAYPSVVKRTFVTVDGKTTIVMAIKCEGPADSCDELKQQFQLMNEKTLKQMQAGK